ncbi:hypothetical protein K2X33_11885 [bacterium]|nr:hypothetical protein [bacterium]
MKTLALLLLCSSAHASLAPAWVRGGLPEETGHAYYVGRGFSPVDDQQAYRAAVRDATEQMVRQRFGFDTQIEITTSESLGSGSLRKSYRESSPAVHVEGFEEKDFFLEASEAGIEAYVLYREAIGKTKPIPPAAAPRLAVNDTGMDIPFLPSFRGIRETSTAAPPTFYLSLWAQQLDGRPWFGMGATAELWGPLQLELSYLVALRRDSNGPRSAFQSQRISGGVPIVLWRGKQTQFYALGLAEHILNFEYLRYTEGVPFQVPQTAGFYLSAALGLRYWWGNYQRAGIGARIGLNAMGGWGAAECVFVF